MTTTSKQAAERPQSLDEIIKEVKHHILCPACTEALESYAAREAEQVVAHREHLQDVETQLKEALAREAERRKGLEALRDKWLAASKLDGATDYEEGMFYAKGNCCDELTALLDDKGTAAGAGESRK